MKKHLFLFAMLLLLSMAAKAQEIVVNTNSLTDFSYIVNQGPSNEDSFNVSGIGLLNDTIPESIIITASENFEISTVSGEGFQTTIVLEADIIGTVESTRIYVRMVDGLSEGQYIGYIRLWSVHAQEAVISCHGQVNRPTLPAPEFSLGGGTYSGEQMVAITCDIEGSSIRYHLDTGSEWMNYSQSIPVNRDLTIWAKATKEGYNDSEEVSAEYAIMYTVTVSADPERGTVDGGGSDFHYGDVATLTATANEGYTFQSWSNGSTENPMEISVTGDTSYYASFAPLSHEIVVIANPENGGRVEGGGTYFLPICTVKATANEGYNFVNWTENGEEVSTEAEYSFSTWHDRTLVANFVSTALPVIEGGITTPEPICPGYSLQLTAPVVSFADTEAWQLSSDSDFSMFSIYTDQALDASYNGWYLRYMASNEWGTTYSESVNVTILPSVSESELDSIVGKKCGFNSEHLLIYPHSGLQYQWYKDNEPINGATEQYYYADKGLSNGIYWVEISKERDEDGNMLCPVFSYEYEVMSSALLTFGMVHPNPSQTDDVVYITREDSGEAMLDIYSIDGRLLYSQTLVQGQNTVHFGLPRGIFIAVLTDSRGEVKTEKIVIQ